MLMNARKNQQGFAHWILILIVFAAIGAVGFIVATRGNNDKGSNVAMTEASETTDPEANLEISNFGLSSVKNDLNISNDALRDYESSGLKGFYVFGDKLSGNRLNPNFEFASVKEGVDVISAIDGIVAFIKQQESGDYEVYLQPKENSIWTIGYDHLTDLKVKKGDSIKIGAKLGVPAKQGNGQLRFEFQVNKDVDGQTTHVCPSTLLAASAKDTQLAGLASMQDSWETVSGKALYDQALQKPTGCISHTLTPQQAEGR